MLKIYDGEVTVIGLEDFDAAQMLREIGKNPDCGQSVYLLEKEGNVLGAVNLENLLQNKIVFHTFRDTGGGAFLEARDFCAAGHVLPNTFFPVLDGRGECLYLLCYLENEIHSAKWPVGELKPLSHYDLGTSREYLDFTLVSQAQAYLFLEVEEYTYAIALLLAREYPEKRLFFLDGRMAYFPELEAIASYYDISSVYGCGDLDRAQCLCITSDGKIYEEFLEDFTHIYNSINVMYSLFWCAKREHFGEKNKGCEIFVADFPGGDGGLVDYIKRVYMYRMIARQHGWKFAVDLCHKPNQYLMAEHENMWEYFFEPLSDIPLPEVYESASVIRASANGVQMYEMHVLPYLRTAYGYVEYNGVEIMGAIKFNGATQAAAQELMPDILKRDNQVLGVVLRGTDYRAQASQAAGRPANAAGLGKMIAKCRYIMELYGYSHVFVATEDSEYLCRMQEEFGGKCLSIEQKRACHDYSTGYVPCARLLAIEDGRDFGRRYLAVIQSLANCKALIANMSNGTQWAAAGLNGSKYEYCEVVCP